MMASNLIWHGREAQTFTLSHFRTTLAHRQYRAPPVGWRYFPYLPGLLSVRFGERTPPNVRPPPEAPCSSEAPAKHKERHPEPGLLQWCQLRRRTVPAPGLQLLFRRLRLAQQADDRRSRTEQPCKALASSETLRRMRRRLGLT